MLTLNILGHVYVTFNGHTVPVSHKGAALLSYLALEGQAHHREHLADLLWDHPQSLRNLRVELTRLKQQGISPFPARQPMLSLNCPTDLDQWTQSSAGLTENTLPDWLARARGFPLSGLEDVGSSTFRDWVDHQRWRISETMERTLTDVYARFSGRGQTQALSLIRERADRLGFTLPEVLATPQENSLFQHTPQQAEVLRIAAQARDSYRSQVVFLHGLPGTPRTLINAAFQGTPWKVMQLQMGAQRRLVQGALIQQLVRGMPEYKEPLLDLLGSLTEEGELDLIRISALIARAGTPLILAVHVTEPQPWLMNAVRFVLDFPHPIVVVLCTSLDAVQRGLQAELGGIDRTQLHHLSIPALGSQAVQRVMQQQGQPCTATQASRWAQCSEGWPLYLQALWETGELPHERCPAQPAAVTHAVLTGLISLPAPVRADFSRLAQIQDRFDARLAAFTLQEPDMNRVQTLLRLGRQHDLLVPAASREDVRLPGLTTWASDLESHVSFASETLRVALATQLSPQERHALRVRLSEAYQDRCPALHQHYAARAGLTPPALPTEQPHGPELLSGERPTWEVLPDEQLHLTPAARQELRTPNGYRIALENGTLEILRKGYLGPAPTLALPFGPLPAGTWRMKVRVDLLRNFTTQPAPYALGIGHAGQLQARYSVQHCAAQTCPDAPPGDETLPDQQWILLTGTSPGGQFEVTVRAMDVALSISELTWNGASLLKPSALLA